MTNENYENDNSENVAEEVETPEEETTEEEVKDDEELSPREKQFLARAKKAEGKLKKQKDEPNEKKPAEEKTSQGLDYGQKAYLIAEGIKRGAETELVEQVMEDSGKNLEDVLDSKYFQGELKVLRDDVKTKIATPSSSKRSTTTSRDKVDYWIAKGELPPIEQIELRRAVVNAKVKQEEPNSNFTSNPTGNITVR